MSYADAQLKLEVGEEIMVFYFTGDWKKGTVLEKQRDGWLVDYFAHGESLSMQDWFHRNQIRKLCEVGALDFARRWESSNGNFKIDAALKDFVGDLDEVILTKTDLKELKVKISSLSTADITYVKKLYKNRDSAASIGMMPALIPKLPELTQLELDAAKTPSIQIGGEGDMGPFGVLPSFLKTFQPEGVGFQIIRARQRVVATIPVGGPDQLVLVTAFEHTAVWDDAPFQSQGYWVSLKQKKVVNIVAVSPESRPVDYDPRHKLLLTVRDLTDEKLETRRKRLYKDLTAQKDLSRTESEDFQKEFGSIFNQNAEYVLWRLQPGESKVEPLIRWHAKSNQGLHLPYAKIINDKIVLAKVDSNTYQAWDLETRREAYSFKISKFPNFLSKNLELTPDRQSIIIAGDNQVSIINAENGELRFALQVPEDRVIGANVDSSGTKLAALTNRCLYVWDLLSGNREPNVYLAPLIGSPAGSRLDWIDDDHVLIEGIGRRVLYRLSLKLPIWSYITDVGYSSDFIDNPLNFNAVGGLFFYVAEQPSEILFDQILKTGRIQATGNRIAVGAVNFPGPRVNQMAETALNENTQSMYVLKPGVHVDIELDSVTDPDQVTQWLKERIQAAGWVYQPGSSLRINAEMGTLPTRTQTFRQFGTLRNDTTSVSITPHFARIRITDGDKIIWEVATQTGVPFFVRSNDIQVAVNEQQVPQLKFFERVKFDPIVMDPEYSYGFGVSRFGLPGIEVVSVTPPGRADDPWAAAEEMEKQLEEDAKPPGVNPDGSEKN